MTVTCSHFIPDKLGARNKRKEIQMSAAPAVSQRPVARPQIKAGAPAQNLTVKADNTRVATPPVTTGVSDAANLSSTAQTAAPSNPYNGVAEGVATVTVEKWSPGNNSKSTLDGILKSQGYSSEEIYGKGEDGKSLLDRVSAVNDLKDPNLIHPDQKLKIPMKEKPAEEGAAKQKASVTSENVAAGESEQTLVRNEGDRLSTQTTVERSEDGSITAEAASRNHANPDTNLTTEMQTGPDGRVASASQETDDGIETVTMGRNADGSAVTTHDQAVTANGSDVSITDTDGNPNMAAAVVDDELHVVNPGTTSGSGDLRSRVDLSEESNDGAFENFGRGVAEFFGFGGDEQRDPQVAGDVSGVQVRRGEEGQTQVLAQGNNGDVREMYSSAGDTDDTWIERGGESVDNFFNSFTPDIPRSEDPNYELTSRGYRRVRN